MADGKKFTATWGLVEIHTPDKRVLEIDEIGTHEFTATNIFNAKKQATVIAREECEIIARCMGY